MTSILLIIATSIPFLFNLYKLGYFITVIVFIDIPLIYLTVRLSCAKDTSTYRFLSGLMKALMPLGLLAIFLGSRGI